MRSFFGWIAAAALGVAVSAQAATVPIGLAAMAQLVRNGVVETPAVIYATVDRYRSLELDLYRPANAKAALPIVMFVHGGAFSGDPFHQLAGVPYNPDSAADNPATLWQLARRGYVVANVTYRLSGEAQFPAQIQDVKQAVRFLRAHAGEIGGDPNRIIAWGASAGGYLVNLLGTSCGVAAFEPPKLLLGGPPIGTDRSISDCVNAVADWYGPVQFATLDAMTAANHLPGPGPRSPHNAPDSPESDLMGCALPVCSADLLREANPLTYVSAQTPPFLIMHGLSDSAVPYEQSTMLAAALKAKGVPVKITLVPGAGHLFMGISKGESDKLTEETFEYIDRISHPKNIVIAVDKDGNVTWNGQLVKSNDELLKRMKALEN